MSTHIQVSVKQVWTNCFTVPALTTGSPWHCSPHLSCGICYSPRWLVLASWVDFFWWWKWCLKLPTTVLVQLPFSTVHASSLPRALPCLFFCRITVLSQGQSGVFILDPILPLPSQLHALIFLFCINHQQSFLFYWIIPISIQMYYNSAYLFLKACYPPFSFCLLPHPSVSLDIQNSEAFLPTVTISPSVSFWLSISQSQVPRSAHSISSTGTWLVTLLLKRRFHLALEEAPHSPCLHCSVTLWPFAGFSFFFLSIFF